MEEYLVKIHFNSKEIEFRFDNKKEFENLLNQLEEKEKVRVLNKNKMPIIINTKTIEIVETSIKKVE